MAGKSDGGFTGFLFCAAGRGRRSFPRHNRRLSLTIPDDVFLSPLAATVAAWSLAFAVVAAR